MIPGSIAINLPNDTILDWTNFKAFAYKKLNVAKPIIYLFYGVENIVVKGENAGYHNVFISPNYQGR